jgi:hypothetical protein
MPVLAYTALDIITQAMIEIGMLAPGEVPDAESGPWAFAEFNNLIDIWQTLEAYVYAQQFQIFNLVAGLSPHTIGPAALVPAPTFSTGIQPRPVKMVGAALLLNTSGTLVDLPMNIRDHAWWAAQQTKQIQTNVPTDLYYEADNPLGSCFFWPVPNAVQQVRLEYWNSISQYGQINDPLAGPGGAGTLPQGYRAALTYSLAEMLCPGAQKEVSPTTAAKALRARSAVFGNNAKSPRMMTQDSGMPRSGSRAGTRGDFNWFTGGVPGGAPE